MENKNYIIGIDLGSHRIVGAAGRMEQQSQSLVLDKVAYANTQGMYQGTIDTTEEIKEGLRNVIQELSKGILSPIQDVYLSHSNPGVSEAFLQSCMPEGVQIKQYFNPSQILANGICKADVLKAGIGIINMGSEYTQVGIYNEGALAYSRSFACGGQWISHDISTVCKEEHVSPGIAELIKKQVGIILDRTQENRNLSFRVQGLADAQKINKLKLTDIIQARIEEWADAVQYLNRKVYSQEQPPRGWIITGGSSQIKNLDLFLSEKWQCEVKRTGPVVQQSSGNIFPQGDPAFSTVISILLEGGKIGPNNTTRKEKNNPLKKITPGIQDLWKDNAEYL